MKMYCYYGVFLLLSCETGYHWMYICLRARPWHWPHEICATLLRMVKRRAGGFAREPTRYCGSGQ